MATHEPGVEKTFEEATIDGFQQKVSRGEATYAGLIDFCLQRIDQWDRHGPRLSSILALNPTAREIAVQRDEEAARVTGPLHGIPIVIKDNCDTVDMPTTAGCLALQQSVPARDSAVVRKLKAAGAIILAKTNLHELALAGITVSSLGGQTLNPYDLTRTPGGSSGGSGVAVTMNFAMGAIGTDTVNSIRSPSSANCTVGLRPSRGLISRAGVVPVSSTQDAVGPMARTVQDAAYMLDALAGYDPEDPITARCVGKIPKSYAAHLDPDGLKGKRVGFLRSLQGRESRHDVVNAAVNDSMNTMRKAGAEVVSIDDSTIDSDELIRNCDVQKWEFKHLFEKYLSELPDTPVRSVEELLASGLYHRESLQDFLTRANNVSAPEHDAEYLARLVRTAKLHDELMSIMAAYRLDALAYPLQKCLVVPVGEPGQIDRNGIVASLAGFSALTVPMGFSPPSATAPLGVPMGLDLMARPFDEPTLIEIGHAFEHAARVRKPPLHEG